MVKLVTNFNRTWLILLNNNGFSMQGAEHCRSNDELSAIDVPATFREVGMGVLASPELLPGDGTKARAEPGRLYTVAFRQVVKEIVDADIGCSGG